MLGSRDIISLSSNYLRFFLRLFLLASLHIYNDSMNVKERNKILTLSFIFYLFLLYKTLIFQLPQLILNICLKFNFYLLTLFK